jgi:hypothetical protein
LPTTPGHIALCSFGQLLRSATIVHSLDDEFPAPAFVSGCTRSTICRFSRDGVY